MKDDPFLIATEHVAWCIRQGICLAQLHVALGRRAGPPFETWNDAIWTLARVYSDLDWRSGADLIAASTQAAKPEVPPLRHRTSPRLESELWPRSLRQRRAA